MAKQVDTAASVASTRQEKLPGEMDWPWLEPKRARSPETGSSAKQLQPDRDLQWRLHEMEMKQHELQQKERELDLKERELQQRERELDLMEREQALEAKTGVALQSQVLPSHILVLQLVDRLTTAAYGLTCVLRGKY